MDEALKAYAALWDLLHDLATEERGLTDVEAEWLYTEQPKAVWDELRSRGLVPESLGNYEPDARRSADQRERDGAAVVRRQSLKHAMETVRREMEESPPWLKEIYARNREIRRRAMQQREYFHEGLCDCTSRDPRRCMQDQCYDLDEPEHDKDECQVCAVPCMCECHSGRRRKDR